jgi:hypothetical protein
MAKICNLRGATWIEAWEGNNEFSLNFEVCFNDTLCPTTSTALHCAQLIRLQHVHAIDKSKVLYWSILAGIIALITHEHTEHAHKELLVDLLCPACVGGIVFFKAGYCWFRPRTTLPAILTSISALCGG